MTAHKSCLRDIQQLVRTQLWLYSRCQGYIQRVVVYPAANELGWIPSKRWSKDSSMQIWKLCFIIGSTLDGQPWIWFNSITIAPRMQDGVWGPHPPPALSNWNTSPCEQWGEAPVYLIDVRLCRDSQLHVAGRLQEGLDCMSSSQGVMSHKWHCRQN